jgi:hypothetical protein
MDKRFQRRAVVDPAVADMLSDMERKRRIASLPKAKQEKARKDAARHKAGLDLPLELHEALRRIAEKEHISVSGLVTFYLHRGVVDYEAGRIDLSPYKRPSRSPRFEYILDFTKTEKP